MKRARKLFLGLVVMMMLTGASSTFAGDGCRMILDQKTGEYKYCCPTGCIWV